MEADLHKRHYFINYNKKLMLYVFADDQVIIADSEDNLQEGAFTLRNTANNFRSEISPEKSETTAFLVRDPVRCTIIMDNACLQQVRNFEYCGCESSYKNDNDIQQKLAKSPQILGILNIKPTLVQKFSRIKVYNAFAVPILLYGSEIWTLRIKAKNDRHQSRWKFLEPTGTPILTTKERRNFGKVESVTSWRETKKYKSNWPRHGTRMNSNRMPKIMLNYRPNGRRRFGRPFKRLFDRPGTDTSRPNSWRLMMMMMMMM